MNEDLIVQIICDKEVGTAFYVAPDRLFTAYHTVASFKANGNNIVKDGQEGDLKFVLGDSYEEIDLAVIKVEGRKSLGYLPLLKHRIRLGEEFISFGYPDTAKTDGLRIKGRITQRLTNTTGDFKLRTEDVDESFDYQGMSGAPVILADDVVGVVIEQNGGSLNIVSVYRLAEQLNDETIAVEKEANPIDLPESIAKNVEAAHPNYSVFSAIDDSLAKSHNKWVLLYGTPGCGKTTLTAGFKPDDSSIMVLGRYFFKVPNDHLSRAIRCSESYFVDWLESVYISITGAEVEILAPEEKRKRISQWFQHISNYLVARKLQGLLIIDGLDELATDAGNRVDEILSLIPDTLPDKIRVVLSCITEEILPSGIIGKLQPDGKIEVTALDIAACESYIQENSGEWDKPYSFIQAVARKTEGHPLYMNYLCRYFVDTFDSATKEEKLNEWVVSLPSIGGDIRSYYESVWKKADPQGPTFEILALLSQTRGAVEEVQLIEMMTTPNPYEFKAATKEFHHLMKEQGTDWYEIYHSSFRLFITEKLNTIIKYTNDQIAMYCKAHTDSIYSRENYLHHVVNGKEPEKGLALCNQEWADQCALLDISPDLVMHDIKECLSFAVDLGLTIEVIRLMLLAQRIENRCDSIMVDNVNGFVDLNIALGKPDVALKYIVRDNMLLVNLPEAMKYLRILIELGYRKQAFILVDSIEAEIRKALSDVAKKGTNPYVFAAKGFLIVEGIAAGLESPHDLERYFGTLSRLREACDEESVETIGLVINMIVAYELSNKLREGKKIDIERILKSFNVDWDERLVLLFVQVLAQYDDKDAGLHSIGQNEAYLDCLRQLEIVLLNCSFEFTDEDLVLLLTELVDKPINPGIVKNLLAKYGYKTMPFIFRNENGVDIDMKSVYDFYQESLYRAYADDAMKCPSVKMYYRSESAWEQYIESLVSRVAYLTGTLYRLRAAKEDYSKVYALVKATLDSIDFSFDTRTTWKRSYLLPEDLIPFVYDKLAGIYSDFFEDKIDDFMEHLHSRMPNQLCLYREGYCGSLIGFVGLFRLNKKLQGFARSLADEAVNYIEYAVQNRSERCTYLLQLCLEYALLNEKDKANAVYREVLNSSMGPEWYKEGQLGLMNAIKETDICFDGKQAAHLAAIFEEASGEMTFQRYVQQSKNQFTGTLVKSASLADAIAYYKLETLPPVERIVKNAEDWKVDMPQTGNGYDLGANHLIESSAICYLLRRSKQVSPYIRYAVSELFWENWDKMHNDWNYAKLHADLFNEVGVEKALEILIPRMAEYFTNEYIVDKKGDYLNDIEETNTPEVVLNRLQSSLQANGFTWKRKTKQPEQERHTDGNKEKLERTLTCKALMDELRKDIVSPLGSYWYSLDQFLIPLTKKPDFDKSKLLNVITTHFDVNVRPSKVQFEKFSCFVGKHDEDNVDKQMIHFLIWFLVHPERKVIMRAEESLKWLVRIDSRVIDCLIEEVLRPSEIGLATVASAMLLEIAKEMPEVVQQHMENDELQKQLIGFPNFSVSRNIYEIARIFKDRCGYEDLWNDMQSVVPDGMPDRGDVVLDNSDMMFIEHKIDKLNNLKVTGGREFARPYLEALKEIGGQDRMKILMKADHYTARSYYMNVWHNGRYNRTMIDLLDRVLHGKVDSKRAGCVYYAINN